MGEQAEVLGQLAAWAEMAIDAREGAERIRRIVRGLQTFSRVTEEEVAVIDIRPDFVEAWNRRATVYYTKKDFGRALADIHEVLAREPRHFGALSGLGIILQELGDDKRALDVFRRALAVHPRLERIPDLVKKLGEKIDGRDI